MSPLKNQLLHAYWIVFEPAVDGGRTFMNVPIAGAERHVPRAVGVTAFTLDDALLILDQDLFVERPRPPLEQVVEDVELQQLPDLARQAGLPDWYVEADVKLATTIFRGVWFPFRGFGSASQR